MRYAWMYWLTIGFISATLVFNIWQEGVFNIINLALVLVLTSVIILGVRMKRFIMELIELSGKKYVGGDTQLHLTSYMTETRTFVSEMHKAISHFSEIGHQSFSDAIETIQNVGIKETLLATNDKIIAFRRKEQENNWVTQGIASIGGIKHNGNDIHDYSLKVISAVVKYLKASQACFVIRRTSDSDEYFELIAAYAYDKKKFIQKRVNMGEGLIGQAFYEKEIIYLTEVPKEYVKITSGLGDALPRCICIVPLISEGFVYGAIEIASFNEFEVSHMEYLRQIAQNIGYNLGAIESQRQTETLLEQSRKMGEEVRSQEEELRQNMEELTATQEQMRRKQHEMDSVLSSLSTVELDLNGGILHANSIFLSITGYQPADLQGQLYKNITPQEGNDVIQYDMMWDSIRAGRSFSGEFRIVNKEKKEMWMAGNFTPILDDRGKPYKVMVISLFTTQDKEKLIELQEMMSAFKGCFPVAEINEDLTFKTANDLFLTEMGIKRIELKRSLPANVLANGSYKKLEQCLVEGNGQPDNIEISIQNKSGDIKRFNSTFIKIAGKKDQRNKAVLILRNTI